MSSYQFEDLATKSLKELSEIHANSAAPTWDSIKGWEFRGYNRLPALAHGIMWMLSNIRFIKVFYEDQDLGGQRSGVNLQVTRGGLKDPWVCRPGPGGVGVGKVGYYQVRDPGEVGAKDYCAHGLFIDYDPERNTLLTGKGLKDFLVQPDPNNPDVLLGQAFMTGLPIKQSPTYFILERFQPYNHR